MGQGLQNFCKEKSNFACYYYKITIRFKKAFLICILVSTLLLISCNLNVKHVLMLILYVCLYLIDSESLRNTCSLTHSVCASFYLPLPLPLLLSGRLCAARAPLCLLSSHSRFTSRLCLRLQSAYRHLQLLAIYLNSFLLTLAFLWPIQRLCNHISVVKIYRVRSICRTYVDSASDSVSLIPSIYAVDYFIVKNGD